MKNKPHKYGMRLERICDCKTRVVSFELYDGEGDNSVSASVSRLIENIRHRNHIFMDRRYSSLLFRALQGGGMFAVGTVMKNRTYIPPEFEDDTGLQKGERIARVANNILATRWKNKRDVHMLSTINRNTIVDTSDGRQHSNF